MELIKEYFSLSEQAIEQLDRLFPLYRDWNSKINVVSRKDIDKLYLHHVLHSLAIAKFVEERGGLFKDGTTVMDVGTGGGFPGIPLAILYPNVDFTLVDSIGKKIKVVNEVVSALGLKNVTAINGRAEEVKGSFNYIVSRAVTRLSNFYPWVKDKYTDGILYLKGGDYNVGGDLYNEVHETIDKFRLNGALISVVPISKWFSDSYFIDKSVIFIKGGIRKD